MAKVYIDKIKNILPHVIVILAVVFPWFLKPGYLFFTDSAFGKNVDLDWTKNWFFLNVALRSLSFVLPMDIVQKLFIGFVLFIVLAGGKKIAENFVRDKWLVFVVSLFALFNPFVYDRVMYGQFGLVLSFGFLCLSVGYLLEYLGKRKDRQIILAGLFIGLTVQFSMHFVFLIAIFSN